MAEEAVCRQVSNSSAVLQLKSKYFPAVHQNTVVLQWPLLYSYSFTWWEGVGGREQLQPVQREEWIQLSVFICCYGVSHILDYCWGIVLRG